MNGITLFYICATITTHKMHPTTNVQMRYKISKTHRVSETERNTQQTEWINKHRWTIALSQDIWQCITPIIVDSQIMVIVHHISGTFCIQLSLNNIWQPILMVKATVFSSLRRKEITLFFAFFPVHSQFKVFFWCFQHITLMWLNIKKKKKQKLISVIANKTN